MEAKTSIPGEEQFERRNSKCNFVYKGRDYYPVPVVDLKGLQDSDPEVRACLVNQVFEAGKVGTFCVVNHGIDDKLLAEFKAAAQAFFALPLEEKAKSSRKYPAGVIRLVGYRGQFADSSKNSPITSRREVFELQGNPPVCCDDVLWPEAVPSFRGCMESYATGQRRLSRWINEALAEGLDLSRDAFLKQMGDDFRQQVLACNYPVQEKHVQHNTDPSSVGFGAHSDLPVMNAVLQDDVGGVQVWADNQWFEITPIPEGITFFLGDPIECMSNGIYHAMIHRVLTPKKRSRFSCCSTFEPVKFEAVFHPAPELVERSGQPAKYSNFSFGGRADILRGKPFDPDTMTKLHMVTDFSVIDTSKNFSFKDGVFRIGRIPITQ